MSFLPTGTVYGTLLNFRQERAALGPRMTAPPYNAAPRAPVLYIKPANTWTPNGRSIVLPAGASTVWVGATIAMLIGPPAPATSDKSAMDNVAGYVLLGDLSLPQPNLFRPPVRYNCADGLLGVGSTVLPASPEIDPREFRLEVRIDGALRQTVVFTDLVRSAPQLLADVAEFMTLRPGDLLMLGCDVLPGSGERLTAQAGQRIELGAPGFEPLLHPLVAEAAP